MKRRYLLVALLALLVAGAILTLQAGDYLTLQYWATQEVRLRWHQQQQPLFIFAVLFLVYMLISVIPGTAGKSLICGWLFGFWQGLVLVSFASTATAVSTMLLSRYLFRDHVREKYSYRLERLNQALEREGSSYLFALRLLPVVPYTFVNLAVGVTPMRTRTFWSISQLGMLPGNIISVYAGANLPDLQEMAEEGMRSFLTPQLMVAFALLGLFPLVVRRVVAWWLRYRHAHDPPAGATPVRRS